MSVRDEIRICRKKLRQLERLFDRAFCRDEEMRWTINSGTGQKFIVVSKEAQSMIYDIYRKSWEEEVGRLEGLSV